MFRPRGTILGFIGTSCIEGTFLIFRYLMDTTLGDAPLPSVDFYLHECPARTVIEVLANKWALLILGVLRRHDGPLRFNEFRRRLNGVTQKMLTQTLRTLERNGLVSRAVYPTVPPKVEYALTDLGVSAAKMAVTIGKWSEEHVNDILAARKAFDESAGVEPKPVR
jgi:DNA-binding HxlR family transcriptional regulator